jgi:hypothetical protein
MFGVRSFLTALYAGRHYKRAQRLEREGRSAEALSLVREGLSVMRSGHVIRNHPGETAVLGMLTVLAERLGSQLGQPGASEADIREVLRILEASPPSRSAWLAQANAESIALLRGRLENIGR